jgi:hypothetical protein
MIDDMQIVEAAQRAERIKAVMPQLGVSSDAIFTVIALSRNKRRRAAKPIVAHMPQEAPAWFNETLEACKGTPLTVSQFLFRAGQFPVTPQLMTATSRWLRSAGRHPRKSSGRKLFDI